MLYVRVNTLPILMMCYHTLPVFQCCGSRSVIVFLRIRIRILPSTSKRENFDFCYFATETDVNYLQEVVSKQLWIKSLVFVGILPLFFGDGEVGKNIYFDRPRVNKRRYSQLKLPIPIDTGRSGHFYEFQRGNIVHQMDVKTTIAPTNLCAIFSSIRAWPPELTP